MSWLTRFFEMILGAPRIRPKSSLARPETDPVEDQPEELPAKESEPATPPQPSLQEKAAMDDDEGSAPPVPAASETMRTHSPEISVLVPEFKNDREGGFTARVVDTLKTAKMLDVVSRNVDLNSPGDNPSIAKIVAFQADARAVMTDAGADLLLFGEVIRGGLRLRLVTAEPMPEGRVDAFAVGDELHVPHNFGAEIANLLYASALVAGLPAKETHRAALAPYLVGAAEQSVKLLEGLPEDLDETQIGSIYTHLGVVAANIWRLQNKTGGLTAAVTAFEKATREGRKEITPLVMAELKLRLGVALQELATINDDSVMFDDALDAFEAVTTALNPKTNRREWGLGYLCLGTAYLSRGKSQLAADDCARANTAFDAAMKVFTKEKDLPRWLEVMTMKGTSLMTAGAINAGVKDLEQAAEVLNEVLEARDRVSQPVPWAQASNALGSAVFALAKRTQDRKRLDEAIACFDSALSVYENLGQTMAVDVVRKNQQRAYRLRESMGG